jgi:hypothetical protein
MFIGLKMPIQYQQQKNVVIALNFNILKEF